jgi:hypothetical protein
LIFCNKGSCFIDHCQDHFRATLITFWFWCHLGIRGDKFRKLARKVWHASLYTIPIYIFIIKSPLLMLQVSSYSHQVYQGKATKRSGWGGHCNKVCSSSMEVRPGKCSFCTQELTFPPWRLLRRVIPTPLVRSSAYRCNVISNSF